MTRGLQKPALGILCAGLLSFSPGCYTPRAMPKFHYEDCAIRGVENTFQVFIGVRPIIQKGELDSVFSADAARKGYLPLVLCVRNEGLEDIALRQGCIRFRDNQGVSWSPAGGGELADDLKASRLFLNAVPGYWKLLADSSYEREQQERRDDYRAKIMPPEFRVPAGYGSSVIVLFHAPKKQQKSFYTLIEGGTLSVSVFQEAERKELEFRIDNVK